MPELDAQLVELFTQGRLVNDTRTYFLLNSVLREVRRYCGWHVTPVREDDVITVDGPGGHLLRLPTKNLIELSALSENGVALDVEADLAVSRSGLVRKKSRGCWTAEYGAIAVTMTHGYTAEEAADFNLAVLRAIDRVDLGGVVTQEVAGVYRQSVSLVEDAVLDERATLNRYRIEAIA